MNQFPLIRVPPAPTIKERIGAFAKRALDLADEIDEIKSQDRHQYDESMSDMEAMLHDAEGTLVYIDKRACGERHRIEAAREYADQRQMEAGLFMFGKSVR